MGAGCAGSDSEIQIELDGLQLSPDMRTDGHQRLELYADAMLGRVCERCAGGENLRVEEDAIARSARPKFRGMGGAARPCLGLGEQTCRSKTWASPPCHRTCAPVI